MVFLISWWIPSPEKCWVYVKGQSIWYKKDKNDNSCYSGSFLLKLDIWQQIHFMVKKVLMS